MARLRRVEAPTTADEVPELLRACFVEDWLDDEAEPLPAWVLSDLASGCGDPQFVWLCVARRRWLAARRKWCEERELTDAHLMAMGHGHGRPRWRNPPP